MGEGWGTREESRQEAGKSRVKRDGEVDLGDTEIRQYGFTK